MASASTVGGEELSFTLSMVGDSHVGKTSLLRRYVVGQYTENYMATIGVDYKQRSVDVDGRKVKLQIWDTAGQERFRAVTKNYYRGVDGIVITYDVTSRASFENVHRWINEMRKNTSGTVQMILIGNKVDVPENERVVSAREGNAFAQEQNLVHFECSAKQGSHVEEAFQHLVKTLIQLHDERASALQQRTGVSAASAAASAGGAWSSAKPLRDGIVDINRASSAEAKAPEDGKSGGGCKC